MEVLKNLFHVSLQANDYAAALAFYRDKLGFEQLFELNVGQFKDMLQMGTHNENDTMPWLTYLRVAPDEYIEMFNGAINPPQFEKGPVPLHADSPLQWFALGTQDVEATKQGLAARGIDTDGDFFTDPNGVRIRIVAHEATAQPQQPRLFTSLAGLALYVNDVKAMTAHFEKMTFAVVEQDAAHSVLTIAKRQFLRLDKANTAIRTREDDVLGHFAVGIHSVPDTVQAWSQNGARCCYQPFQPDELVPADSAAKGSMGLDRCEIIWMVCPEGNKVEVMVEPGNTMQQEWERTHPY